MSKGIIVGRREQQQEMVKALNRFDWVPVIDRTFSVDQMAEAFKYQESGQHFGKICIQH